MRKQRERPEIPSIKKEIGTKDIESFQNESLRPIIKLLHPVLLMHFSTLLQKKKGQYFKIAEDQKDAYIHAIFQTEIRYKSELKGMVIGNFDADEYNTYLGLLNSIDKRIFSIVEDRILTNQDELKDLRHLI